MLQNAYLLAKVGADTSENEQHFAEICQKLAAARGQGSARRRQDPLRRPELLKFSPFFFFEKKPADRSAWNARTDRRRGLVNDPLYCSEIFVFQDILESTHSIRVDSGQSHFFTRGHLVSFLA